MWYVPTISFSVCPYKPLYSTIITHEKISSTVQYRIWSPTANDPLYSTFYPFSRLQAVVLLSSEPMQQIVQLMVKRRRDWGIWSPTANDPLYSTFYPFSRLQAVVLLSSEPMQQIVQVNGKKEERLGQREEKGLLCFLLLGSTLISSPLPSVHILPCLKRKIRDCLQSIY